MFPPLEEVEYLLRTQPLPPLYLSKTVENIREAVLNDALFYVQFGGYDEDSILDTAEKKLYND